MTHATLLRTFAVDASILSGLAPGRRGKEPSCRFRRLLPLRLVDPRQQPFGLGEKHRVSDWVSFGGPVVKSGDPVEQEKQLKYASLVANTIMLSNVADMTGVLASMAEDKHPITPGLAACLSPYAREHIRRFGQYVLDMNNLPGPLEPQPLPFEPAPCDHFLHVS